LGLSEPTFAMRTSVGRASENVTENNRGGATDATLVPHLSCRGEGL
jgi:hypothetical protein